MQRKDRSARSDGGRVSIEAADLLALLARLERAEAAQQHPMDPGTAGMV